MPTAQSFLENPIPPVNRQGPWGSDWGSQSTAIFFQLAPAQVRQTASEEWLETAHVTQAKRHSDRSPVTFYPAEDYHQQYLGSAAWRAFPITT